MLLAAGVTRQTDTLHGTAGNSSINNRTLINNNHRDVRGNWAGSPVLRLPSLSYR